MMIIHIGDTPSAHIASAQATGIQMVNLFSFALCPKRKVGTAISATTAGRIPRKIAATIRLSSNCLKKIAMARMIRKEGSAVPRVVAMAPRTFFNL